MNLYDLLELPTTASIKEIKIAYKRLAKRYHPDVNKLGSQTFVEINNAYSILSDPNQKEKYDSMLKVNDFQNRIKNLDISVRWHENFMEELELRKNWEFDFFSSDEDFFYSPFTKNKYASFLDKDVSLAFFQLYSKGKIDHQLEKSLLKRRDVKEACQQNKNFIEVIKEQYNYFGWIEAKRYFNINVELELTQREIRDRDVVNLPLKIKVINNDFPNQLWYEIYKNYSFRLSWDIKNGEIAEFFNKGNRALGWKGDLIVRMKVVNKVNKRLRIFSSFFENDKSKLWFLVPNDKQSNPNKGVFNYKTQHFID
ncbi:J domain-containing protein [Mycoplasmoides genitalium]|uniref:DnaJ-like protein MG002 n=2 Tax=Mycoplasmoides genitalium TaxID=2097 RepID=DNAJL_MYCGE|nr:J domain-containing protein [Mycoplasmoides genitalium]P47248.2 RecName: Full=DnaJ-like protein MG002 [Mycoplasmoides genitalium G37]ABY79502.1 DnaJ domain protein [synthetic Mycoplasma genitalium JCVI-1.0]AAA57070.1 unknown [Mycoplasmoides genitalium]AAC71218.2 DnaJ domain protein [Mycoplasmoides genitalium G37]AFQ02813.1 DnaJ domain-containing protein [Mycoplasmoides genitalium M2321]AFQ03312.1 DnaJ domain-containing protein [Mycoplasmoides genitalium M6282]